jgi:hypothetical protein
MPQSRPGDAGPQYFVTGRGRVELYDDRALFIPGDGSAMVRASATQPSGAAARAPAAAPPALHVHDTFVGAPAGKSAAATGPAGAPPATTAPAATNPFLLGGTLTPGEVQAVVQQAQAQAKLNNGTGLLQAQVAALQTLLSAPTQQLVTPGASQGAVVAYSADAGGNASLFFSDGAVVVIGPQGNVVSQVFTPSAGFPPGFSINPWAVPLFIATAVLSVGLAVFLLVAAIFVLRDSHRGRRLHLVYAGIKIPAALGGGFAIGFVAYQIATLMTAASPSLGSLPNPTRYALLFGGIAAALGCAYPVALLVALNTRKVRAYYHSAGAGD